MLRDECRHFDDAFAEKGMLKQTTFFDVSLHFMQFSKCRLKLDVVSAFSLVQDYNTFIYERLFSTLVANVARVALSLSLRSTLVGGRRFRPNFGHLEFIYFWVQHPSELSVAERNLLSGADKCPSYRCCSISVHVPTSFCCCGLQPVFPSKEVEHRSREV